MARGVYIVGEDEVTRTIIRRIVSDYAPHLMVIQNIPARGSEIKTKIAMLNNVAASVPVILLSDLDTDSCAPIAKSSLLKGIKNLSKEFVINIAVDEAEAWLLADTNGFSGYFGIPLDRMPLSSLQKFLGMTARIELDVPTKSSYYLTHELAKYSTKSTVVARLFSSDTCKGKEYNTQMIPFILHGWDVEVARKNSYSLDRMIHRIQAIHD